MKRGETPGYREEYLKEIGTNFADERHEDLLVNMYGAVLLASLGNDNFTLYSNRIFNRATVHELLSKAISSRYPKANDLPGDGPLFVAYMNELINRGFVTSRKDDVTKADIYDLTPQGKVEADLYKAQVDVALAEAENDLAKTYYLVIPSEVARRLTQRTEDSRNNFMEAANRRYEFWHNQVLAGVELSEDDRKRIVSPKHEFGYYGLLPDSIFRQEFDEDLQRLVPNRN